MSRPPCLMGLSSVVGLCLLAASCQQPTVEMPAFEPPQVPVVKPVERRVTDTEEFTAKVDAKASVDIRARVTGYLTKVFFYDGFEVKRGDPLFLIDPRPYEMTLRRDQSQVAVLEARLIRANAELARAKGLVPQKAISGSDFDQTVAEAAEVKASLESAKAAVERAALDIQFTQVTAPIDGRISRTLITEGNLVSADNTLLTTIVSVDPVYAYFDMAENVFQQIQQRVREGKIKYVEADKLLAFLALSTETGFPHEGYIDFAENRVDPNTGTLRLRGVFPNPKPENSGRLLMPGMFARVRIPIGDPRPMLLVPEQALGTDQGQKFVYVVNSKSEVEYRRVTLGKLEGDLRAIDDGLRPDDQVIVRGVQRVRPGMPVKPKLEPLAAPDAKQPAAPAAKPDAAKPAAPPATEKPTAPQTENAKR